MAKLPKMAQVRTIDCVEALRYDNPRGYSIGMSKLGETCERRIWLEWKWVLVDEEISSKVRKIFDFGTWAEPVIIRDLEKAGMVVTDQQEKLLGFAGHIKGFTDGCVLGVKEAPKTLHLLEMKTANIKNFNLLKKKGVKHQYPKHYAQMQRYMGAKKLDRALYVCLCKDNQEYYIERVYFSQTEYTRLTDLEKSLVMSSEAPPLLYDKTFFECKFCPMTTFCHDGAKANKNCRTCKNIDLCNDGKYECGLTDDELNKEQQIEACDFYEYDVEAFENDSP